MSRPRREPRPARPNRHRHFRSFWALLYREAAYRFLLNLWGDAPDRPTRARVWRMPKHELISLIARIRRAYPERRNIL